MRESEKQALAEIGKRLTELGKDIKSLVGGKIPTVAAAEEEAEAPRWKKSGKKPAKEAAVEGPLHAVEVEEGYQCNIKGCKNPGPYKVSEIGLHLWDEHDIPMVEMNIENLTHGRKWQIKKSLEKQGFKDALKGYGRGAKKPSKPGA